MQFNFEGNYDLVRFIKEIGRQDLYATLRIGPYIEAEWNQGYTYINPSSWSLLME